MNRKILVLTVFLGTLSLVSCNQQNPTNSNMISQSTVNEEVGKNPLPDGVHYGKVESYIGQNQVEKNLMSQIDTYQKALLRGDIDGAASFLYPDAITYFRRFYPQDFTDNAIIREFYKDMSETVVKMIQEYKNNGIDIEMIVVDIERIIETNNAIFSVFGLTMQMYNEGAKGEKYIHVSPTSEDYTVGISFNKGQNWSFIALNEDTPNILRLKFSNEIITKVMGY